MKFKMAPFPPSCWLFGCVDPATTPFLPGYALDNFLRGYYIHMVIFVCFFSSFVFPFCHV